MDGRVPLASLTTQPLTFPCPYQPLSLSLVPSCNLLECLFPHPWLKNLSCLQYQGEVEPSYVRTNVMGVSADADIWAYG